MIHILRDILIVGGYIVGSFLLAAWLGYLMGVYQASREASFRRRAIKLMAKNGQVEDFLILSGQPQLVAELYEIVVATSARAEELAADQAANDEGIAIDDRTEEQKQNTDRSR